MSILASLMGAFRSPEVKKATELQGLKVRDGGRMRQMWRSVGEHWNQLSPEVRQALAKVSTHNEHFNRSVHTRQVLRAKARRDAFELVTEDFGGEVRKYRRRIALARARREWRPFTATA